MATPREVYETLVGEASGMGVGDFQSMLKDFVRRFEDEGGFSPNLEQSEEFLREIAEAIADEDEFDDEEAELDEEEEASEETEVLDEDEEFEEFPSDEDD